MASKFFGSDSSDASSESSDSDVAPTTQKKSVFAAKKLWSDSSSSEDEVRVIKSQSVKRMDAFVDLLKGIRSHVKNNDYTGLAVDYASALKAYEKHQAVSSDVPKAFIRVLYELDSFISELQSSGATKKMSQIKAQAVNKLKAQMKKSNKPFEEMLTACFENPSEFEVLNDVEEELESEDEEEDSEASSSDASSDGSSDESSDGSGSSDGSDDSESSDGSNGSSSSFGSSSFDSSSSESSDEGGDDEVAKRERRMRRWLKDSDESDYEGAKQPKVATGWEVKRAEKKERKVAMEKAKRAEGDEEEEAPVSAVGVVVLADLSEKELIDRFDELLVSKNRIDANLDLLKMDEIAAVALEVHGSKLGLSMQVSIVSLILSGGLFRGISDEFFLEICDKKIPKILQLLSENSSLYPVVLSEYLLADEAANAESVARFRMSGNATISGLVELLDEEFSRSFSALETNEEYATKLKYLPNLIELLISMLKYLQGESSMCVSRISLKLLFHLHYQSRKTLAILCERIPKLASFGHSILVEFVLTNGSKKDKASAILLQAFIESSRGDVALSRKLMSADLFDLVSVSEVGLQIQYNRALAQVGLGAFLNGDIRDAYNLLTDLCTSGRLRELLAQGLTRANLTVEKTAASEAERNAEKRRLLPFHLHLNIEQIEAAYSLSAMILDVALLSASNRDERISRRLMRYKRQLDSHDRQVYSGRIAEFPKDAVILAGKCIMNDDIEGAIGHIEGMHVWSSDIVLKIVHLVRIAGLQAYLLNNCRAHVSFDLGVLGKQFGLEFEKVKTIVSKYILGGEMGGKISNNLFIPVRTTVGKLDSAIATLEQQTRKLEDVSSSSNEEAGSAESAREIIKALLNPAVVTMTQGPPPEIGARRVRGHRVGLANAKALAASQQAAERRLQAGVARRRGWDNARQPLQGTVISTERKRTFGKSYGF